MPFTSLRPWSSRALNAEGRPLIPHQAGGLGRRAEGLGKLGWAGVELGKGEVKRGDKGKGSEPEITEWRGGGGTSPRRGGEPGAEMTGRR